MSRAFTLEVDMGNAALVGPDRIKELCRILEHARLRIILMHHDESGTFSLYDINGNKVGRCTVPFDELGDSE